MRRHKKTKSTGVENNAEQVDTDTADELVVGGAVDAPAAGGAMDAPGVQGAMDAPAQGIGGAVGAPGHGAGGAMDEPGRSQLFTPTHVARRGEVSRRHSDYT